MPLTSTVGRLQFINIRPIDPRTEQTGLRWRTDPIHDYRVTFWRRGASSEFDLSGAADVHEALEWAEEEALARESTYTLLASVDRGPDRGLVWLAGVETRLSGRVRTSNHADGSSVVTTGGSVLVSFTAPFNPRGPATYIFTGHTVLSFAPPFGLLTLVSTTDNKPFDICAALS